MTPGQRRRYHVELWPAAARANGWLPRDEVRRRYTTRECMRLISGPDTESTTDLRQDEITALFCFLEHLGAPDSLDKSARWDTCLQDYHTYSRAKQADWHERQLYGYKRNKLDRDRFAGATSASGGALDDLDPEQVRQRHLTMASRHQKKLREQGTKKHAAPKPAAVQPTPATSDEPAYHGPSTPDEPF